MARLFALFAVVTLIPLAGAWRQPLHAPGNNASDEDEAPTTFRQGLRDAWRAVQKRDVLRWLILLQFSDLLLDVLYGFLALYFVDVAGVSATTAALAVTLGGRRLVGDALLIPLLERVRGCAICGGRAGRGVAVPAFLLTEPCR